MMSADERRWTDIPPREQSLLNINRTTRQWQPKFSLPSPCPSIFLHQGKTQSKDERVVPSAWPLHASASTKMAKMQVIRLVFARWTLVHLKLPRPKPKTPDWHLMAITWFLMFLNWIPAGVTQEKDSVAFYLSSWANQSITHCSLKQNIFW